MARRRPAPETPVLHALRALRPVCPCGSAWGGRFAVPWPDRFQSARSKQPLFSVGFSGEGRRPFLITLGAAAAHRLTKHPSRQANWNLERGVHSGFPHLPRKFGWTPRDPLLSSHGWAFVPKARLAACREEVTRPENGNLDEVSLPMHAENSRIRFRKRLGINNLPKLPVHGAMHTCVHRQSDHK